METIWTQADEAAIAKAAALLRAGQLVAFPTETVYGLGADALNAQAVREIFVAKGRPADNPLIVHIAQKNEIYALVQAVDERAEQLMTAFWPGPLTIILPKAPCIPEVVTAGLPAVAVRMPSHPVARALITQTGRPIAAPSANRSGKPSPTTAAHVWTDLCGRIPLILDGGAADVGVESTVVDLTGETPVLLRPGGVTVEMLRVTLPSLRVDEAVLKPLAEGVRPRSPGMKYRHYAPEAQVVIVRGEPDHIAGKICMLYDADVAAGKRTMILASQENSAFYGSRQIRVLGARADLGTMTAALFAGLRAADAEGMEQVYAEAVDTRGIGLALMNRLGRAAAFHWVDA